MNQHPSFSHWWFPDDLRKPRTPILGAWSWCEPMQVPAIMVDAA